MQFMSRSDLVLISVLDADHSLDFSYLVLQACISSCSVSDKAGALLFLPFSHKNAIAHMLSLSRPKHSVGYVNGVFQTGFFEVLFPGGGGLESEVGEGLGRGGV